MLMSKHLCNVHTCMHWCPGHLFSTCHNQCTKCTYTRTSTPVRRCSNFFAMQSVATHLATWVLPKKPSNSTPAPGAVAAALSHRHHLIIRLGACPIQFDLWLALKAWPRSLSVTKFSICHSFRMISHIYSKLFSLHDVFIVLSLSSVTNLSLLVGVWGSTWSSKNLM